MMNKNIPPVKIQLSVAIITFNEEKNIERCLLSVKDVADEIVVVDSYSTDKTEEICSELKVRFIKHKFTGHIEQKNWAAEQAKNDYVLSLDADEVLSEELIASIKKVKENWGADGYSMNRMTNYCGKWIKHCGWYPDKKLRLWHRRKGKWGGVNPHDKYEMHEDAIIRHLKGDILHYSYYTIAQHIEQIQKFSEINARMKYDKKKNISPYMIFLRIPFTFIKKYVFNLGILDGYYGFVVCVLASYNTFLKDIKLRQLNEKSDYDK